MHPRKLSLLGTALYVMVTFRGIHQKLQNGHHDCDGRFGILIMVDAGNATPDIYQLLFFFEILNAVYVLMISTVWTSTLLYSSLDSIISRSLLISSEL